jgi:pectate lyase
MHPCVARAVLLLPLATGATPAFAIDVPPEALAVARQALPAGDGWASVGAGVTGGAAAPANAIHVVTTRAELIAALGGDAKTNGRNDAPAIIFIAGTIDLNVDDAGRPMTPADYGPFDTAAYRAAYDPKVWGKRKLEGPLEEARQAAKARQSARIILDVGSNKTVIGLGADARVTGGTLRLNGVENVVVRNIAFEDGYDFFPEWDPNDGPDGNWNSEYDLLVLTGGTKRVWIDHNSFSDGHRTDDQSEIVYGREVQHHDGAIDIVRGSSFVTLSYNHIFNHDKSLLFGNSDGRKEDAGALKVTLHHTFFENSGQRAPRVRYGEVHAYNNLHVGRRDRAPYPFVYGLGIGFESKLISEANVFEVPDARPENLIEVFKGKTYRDTGSLLNGQPVDIVGAWNAAHPATPLSPDVDWTPPTPRDAIQPADTVAAEIRAKAGPGKILP